MDFPLFDFVTASVLMGLGIGVDVALATVARSAQLQTARLILLWVVGVSLTHTVFPMVGYLMAYFSVQVLPGVTPLIGVLAFSCIFVYLKGELVALVNPQDPAENRQLLITLGLILAVSWDALWSGPAKSAQVIGWPELLVRGSFLVVGALVSLLAIFSLRFASHIHCFTERRPALHWAGLWVQYSVIAYFGLLALLRYTLNAQMSWWQILCMALGLMGLCLGACLSKRKSLSPA